MNILVGISDTLVLDKINVLSIVDRNINIIHVYSYEDGLKKYTNNDIDILIVNIENKDFNKLLNSIIDINSQQKTIVISNSLDSCDTEGCIHCKQIFLRKRLLDTFEVSEYYKLIKSFDSTKCNFFDTYVNILEKLDKVLLRYENVSYNSKTKTIYLDKKNHQQINDLIDIQNLLTQHNIKYKTVSIN